MRHLRSTPHRSDHSESPTNRPWSSKQQSVPIATSHGPPGAEDCPGNVPADKQPVVVTTVTALVTHVIWFFVGPIAILLMLWALLDTGSPTVSSYDLVFFGLVAMTVGCRWLEQRSGQATTVEGTPATWNDFRAYLIGFPIVALTAWLATKGLLLIV